MHDVLWKSTFPQVYKKVKQLPLARNIPPAQWMFLSLENDLISSDEYLNWAPRYYGLATLHSNFFRDQFSSELYEKYKKDFEWGPQAIPVFEWDGVLFVACIDPHSVPSYLNCRPILARYEDLKKAWQLLSNPQNNPQNLATQDMQHTFSPGYQEGEQQGLNQLEQNPLNLAAPETLIEKLTPPQVNNLFELVDEPSLPPTTSLEGNDLEENQLKLEPPSEMPEGLNLDLGVPNLASPSMAEEDSQILRLAEGSVLDDEVSLVTAPPPPPKIPAPAIGAGIVPPPKPDTVTATATKLTVLPSVELEEELKLSFVKAYQNYRNLMILKIHGQSVVPLRWDSSYKNIKATQPIPLDKPSIFRIAAKTRKPFHGAISPCTTNARFFDSWFSGHVPLCVTIVPLFFERDCVGLLFGASDEPLDRKDSLNLMISTAHNVEANFVVRIAS